MVSITIDNYEAFLLDYLEGNLDDSAVLELKAFAINHPELEIDLEDADLPKIVDEELKFDFKSELKKTHTGISPETLFDYLENTLPELKRKEVEDNLLINKDLEVELRLLKKTILSADLSESFPGKTSLYKNEEELILKDQVLAYFENQLSGSEKTNFEIQLKNNLDLQKELALYSRTRLKADPSVIFADKEALKKWALAYFEGLLSGEEKSAFEVQLKSSEELQAELNAYTKTKLIVDAAVIYPDKEGLKKEARVVALFSFRTVAAIAAAILLLAGLFVVFNYYNGSEVIKPEMANNSGKENLPESDKAPASGIHKNSIEGENKKPELMASVKSKLEVKSSSTKTTISIPNQKTLNTIDNEVMKPEDSKMAVESLKKQEPLKNEVVRENEKLLAHDQNKMVKPLLSDSVKETNSLPEVTEKLTTLLAVVESDDEIENSAADKKGFWNKAVRLAKRANDLGIKSVDGTETSRKKFSLSFNSFSVEKH